MGGGSSIQYCVPVSQKKQGESAVYRSPVSKDKLLEGPTQDIKDMKKALLTSCKQHSENNCLGRIVRKEGTQDKIQYLTYKQVYQQAVAIGSSIIHENLYYQPEGQNMKFVGLFSRNRPQWTIVDVACAFFKLVTVPLYDTLGDENISYVLKHTQMTTIFVNEPSLKALMKTKDLANLKTIVCFDTFSQQQKKYFEQKGIKVREYSQLLQIGKKQQKDYGSQQYKVSPKDCLSFCYTSGTTGPPKGAMLSHGNYCSFLGACDAHKDVGFNENDVVLSYLPLPHVLQRQLLYVILYTGGTIVYYSGDVQKIKDDLALVKPTVFVSVPRLFSRFNDAVKKKLGQLQGWTKTALDHGLNVKLKNVSTNGGYTHKVYDRLFFNKTKAALGGRVRLMISGSAPLIPQTHKFLKVVMAAPLLQGYGQTQSTGAAFITCAADPLVGHVGGSTANIEFKLVDIPQMKYTSNDKDQQGRSTPRGQIWMRGPAVFLGYYKSDQKTKQALTQDGWLRSGDVGVILPQNQGLKIIDRKKNIFKLSQGQYVAAQKVEKVYNDCDIINEIFLHGQSTESYAIAIVTVDHKKLESKANEVGVKGSFEQICTNPKVRTAVLTQMNNFGKKEGLKGFQMAKNIFIQPEGFQARQILTNTMKVQRHEAKNVYKKQIQALYKEGMLGGSKE